MVDIRPAAEAEIPAITDIYRSHVLNGLASFEIEPPDEREMLARFTVLRDRAMPYFVAELDRKTVGYAYAGPYRARPAYRFTVENSVYLAPQMAGRGVGRALLTAVISACQDLGYRQMVAIIGDSGNAASIGLHASLGFKHTGTLTAVGFKAGRWVDSVLMQRALGAGADSLPD